MPSLHRVGTLITAAAAAMLGFTALIPPAHADFTFYVTSPHIGACWSKVNAYGGVYQVVNNLLNGTSAWHTAQVQVFRPGGSMQSDQSYTAAPGVWKQGAIANVAVVPNDNYSVFLDGTPVVGIPANGIPYYMNHCKVSESPSAKVRAAISYGLAQLDSIYVGCAAGNYRHGVIPPTTMRHDGTTCGQKLVYLQPAGVKGYDCSGLVHEMFNNAGVYFPWDQSSVIKHSVPQIVDKTQVRVGDLLVKDGHVAVYLGDGDGDGIASYLEATPKTLNADGTWTGVVISDANEADKDYLGNGQYTVHRPDGL